MPPRRREIRVGEAADRDADEIRQRLAGEAYRHAAARTEPRLDPASGVAAATKGAMLAGDGDHRFGIKRGIAERAAAAALAIATAAGIDLDRLAARRHRQFPAATGGDALAHGPCFRHIRTRCFQSPRQASMELKRMRICVHLLAPIAIAASVIVIRLGAQAALAEPVDALPTPVIDDVRWLEQRCRD